MTLDEAIERLKQNYELAQNMSFVRKPLSWALYRTWEESERKRKWKN